MDIKTIGIGVGIGIAVTSGMIFGLQAVLRSERRKGKREGEAGIYEEQMIADAAVKNYRKNRFSFLKRKGS